MRIVHLTAVHHPLDTRIAYHECRSAAEAGHEVILVHLGPSPTVDLGFRFFSAGPAFGSRFERMTQGQNLVWKAALSFFPDVLHIHDPELLPAAAWHASRGKQVVMDVHENIPEQIAQKPWLPGAGLFGKVYGALEGGLLSNMHLVLAEDSYWRRYIGQGRSTTVVRNFVRTTDFEPFAKTERAGYKLLYIGRLLEDRGAITMIEMAAELRKRGLPITLQLIGPGEFGFREALLSHPAAQQYPGMLSVFDRLPLEEAYAQSRDAAIGLAVLHPTGNYSESYPTKMFEYMACGLPVLASDFPLYRSVVESSGAGRCANPTNWFAMADVVQQMLADAEGLHQMGVNGMQAVANHYAWNGEAAKLMALYSQIGQYAFRPFGRF